MTILILAALAGVLLGTRFKVFILAPIVFVGCAAILGIGLARGDAPVTSLLLVFETMTVLQIGYMAGMLIGKFVVMERARTGAPGMTAIVQRLFRQSRA
jgi:hypothetical protein